MIPFRMDSVVHFEEGGTVITALIMELNKPSRNGRVYTWDSNFAESFIGKPVHLGTKCKGKICGIHDIAKKTEIGKIESVKRLGNQVIAKIRVTSRKLVDEIKSGTKFFFSVKGIGSALKKLANGASKILNPMIHSLQIFRENIAGFKSTKILGFSESVLYVEEPDITIRGNIKRVILEL